MSALRIPVPTELFAPAKSSHFTGELEWDVLEAGPDRYAFSAPLAWRADITNTGDALLVRGTVEGEATTACARCLEPVTFAVSGEMEGYFLIGGETSAPDDMDEDEFDVLPDDKVIDMEPLIGAALLLEMPLVPLCDDDCKGLCPTCGANLNEGPCACAPVADGGDTAAAEAAARNPFSVLKDFPFEG